MVSRNSSPAGKQAESRQSEEYRLEVREERNKSNSQEMEQNNEIQTWDVFTQNTAIHGIKYIFEKSRFKFRRYLKLP